MKKFTKFFENIFGSKNEGIHKVIRIFGLKIKFKLKRLQQQIKLEEIHTNIKLLHQYQQQTQEQIQKQQQQIQEQIQKQQQQIQEQMQKQQQLNLLLQQLLFYINRKNQD